MRAHLFKFSLMIVDDNGDAEGMVMGIIKAVALYD